MSSKYHRPPNLFGRNLDVYLSKGWFRSGQLISTTHSLSLEGKLYYPVRTRLPLKGYTFRKSLRKIWRKNQHFKVICQKAEITDEQEALYQKFIVRFDSYIAPTLQESLLDFETTSIYDTYEMAIYAEDKLIAVSFFDVGEVAMASIMGVFDPEYGKYSLGIYTMLLEINFGRINNFDYYYPGYVIPGYPKFDYKLRIGAVEFYDTENDIWAHRAYP